MWVTLSELMVTTVVRYDTEHTGICDQLFPSLFHIALFPLMND